MIQQGGNGWSVYEKLVIHRLNTVDEQLKEIEEQVLLMRIELAQRKVKAGLWGAAAGSIPAIATAVIAALT